MNAVAIVDTSRPGISAREPNAGPGTETSQMFFAVLEALSAETQSGKAVPESAGQPMHESATPAGHQEQTSDQLSAPVSISTSPERVDKTLTKPKDRPACGFGPTGHLDLRGAEGMSDRALFSGTAVVADIRADGDEWARDARDLRHGPQSGPDTARHDVPASVAPHEDGTAPGFMIPEGIAMPANTGAVADLANAQIGAQSALQTANEIRRDTVGPPRSAAFGATGPEGRGTQPILVEVPSNTAKQSSVNSAWAEDVSTAGIMSEIRAAPGPETPDDARDGARQPNTRIGREMDAHPEQRAAPSNRTGLGPAQEPEKGNIAKMDQVNEASLAPRIRTVTDARGLTHGPTTPLQLAPEQSRDTGTQAPANSPPPHAASANLSIKAGDGLAIPRTLRNPPQGHSPHQRGHSPDPGRQEVQVAHPSRPGQALAEPAAAPAAASAERSATADLPDPATADHRMPPIVAGADPESAIPILHGHDGPSAIHISESSAKHNVPAAGALPDGLGRMLAHAASQFTDRPIEMTLSPEELGRVRMTLATHDGSLTMAIQADRPETLDLLRRHIDTLAQDFRNMGFDNLNFSFGRDQDHNPQGGNLARNVGTLVPETSGRDDLQGPKPARRADAAKDGLDLRM